jgi:hypothetical protein
VQLLPPGIGKDLPGKSLHRLQLDLVSDGDRFAHLGQQDEEPTAPHPPDAQDPRGDRIEAVKVEEQPGIRADGVERLGELLPVRQCVPAHPYPSAAAARHWQS